MSEFNAYDPPSPPRNNRSALSYKFTPEELRVLSDCNKESFYGRSLPIATFLGLGAYAAVNKGYWKGSPRFGAIPKVSIAVIFGYFVGKISYQMKCAEKLMNLPGSHIGQILREKRQGKTYPMAPNAVPPMLGANPEDVYSDAGPGSSLDFDTDRPAYNEDDSYQSNSGMSTEDTPARPPLSYDDLRKSHRQQFGVSKGDPYRVPPPQNAPFRPPSETSPRSATSRSTNKYGDETD